MKTLNKTQFALKLYFWIQFYKGQKKVWLHLYIPEDAGSTNEELERYLTSGSRIFDLQEHYAQHEAYGAYNWEIVSKEKVKHSFRQYYNNFDHEIAESPEEKKALKVKSATIVKKQKIVANIHNHPIDVKKVEFSDLGELVYKDKLFGEVKFDLKKLKDFILDPTFVKFKVFNTNNLPVITVDSSKNKHTGEPPYNPGVADFQIWFDGAPKNITLFNRVGDIAIFIHRDGNHIVIISKEKALTIHVTEFLQRAFELQNLGIELDIQKFIENK